MGRWGCHGFIQLWKVCTSDTYEMLYDHRALWARVVECVPIQRRRTIGWSFDGGFSILRMQRAALAFGGLIELRAMEESGPPSLR